MAQPNNNPKSYLKWLGPICGALLLATLLGLNSTHLTPADASDYHQQVAEQVRALDYEFAGWKGVDTTVPPSAVELLRPNVLLSRRYTNAQGDSFSLLIVHCKDARDLLGHYPPVCYPAQGWRLADSEPVSPLITPLAEAEEQYRFNAEFEGRSQMIYVRQLFVLPDGTLSSRMEDVERVADNFGIRHFGGMQMQIVSNKELTGLQVADQLADQLAGVINAVRQPAGEQASSKPTP